MIITICEKAGDETICILIFLAYSIYLFGDIGPVNAWHSRDLVVSLGRHERPGCDSLTRTVAVYGGT
jgi:hypothetical protein